MKTERHYIAVMDIGHVQFIVIGKTEELAKRAILKEWNSSPYREKATLASLEAWYGIRTFELADGECKFNCY